MHDNWTRLSIELVGPAFADKLSNTYDINNSTAPIRWSHKELNIWRNLHYYEGFSEIT